MSSHELPPIELKLATDAESVASGVPVSAKKNLMDLEDVYKRQMLTSIILKVAIPTSPATCTRRAGRGGR